MFRILLVLMIAVSLTACSGGGEAEKTDTGQTQTESQAGVTGDELATADVALDGTPVTLAGLKFTPPSTWTDLGPSGMRKGDYAYGPIAEENDSATVNIFYFGPNQGGDVKSNIDRWIGQVTPPEGVETGENVYYQTIQVDGMPTHVVKVRGAYNASMGGPMSGDTQSLEDYLLVGVVVEAPEGNVFFKLTGPQSTADEMSKMFMTAIKGMEKTA